MSRAGGGHVPIKLLAGDKALAAHYQQHAKGWAVAADNEVARLGLCALTSKQGPAKGIDLADK